MERGGDKDGGSWIDGWLLSGPYPAADRDSLPMGWRLGEGLLVIGGKRGGGGRWEDPSVVKIGDGFTEEGISGVIERGLTTMGRCEIG